MGCLKQSSENPWIFHLITILLLSDIFRVVYLLFRFPRYSTEQGLCSNLTHCIWQYLFVNTFFILQKATFVMARLVLILTRHLPGPNRGGPKKIKIKGSHIKTTDQGEWEITVCANLMIASSVSRVVSGHTLTWRRINSDGLLWGQALWTCQLSFVSVLI